MIYISGGNGWTGQTEQHSGGLDDVNWPWHPLFPSLSSGVFTARADFDHASSLSLSPAHTLHAHWLQWLGLQFYNSHKYCSDVLVQCKP